MTLRRDMIICSLVDLFVTTDVAYPYSSVMKCSLLCLGVMEGITRSELIGLHVVY